MYKHLIPFFDNVFDYKRTFVNSQHETQIQKVILFRKLVFNDIFTPTQDEFLSSNNYSFDSPNQF